MKISKKKLTEELKKNFGMVSPIAKKYKVSVQTIYERIKKDPELQLIKEESREIVLDAAEIKLYKAVNQGREWAVKMILNKLGHLRGYTSHQQTELIGSPGTKVNQNFSIEFIEKTEKK